MNTQTDGVSSVGADVISDDQAQLQAYLEAYIGHNVDKYQRAINYVLAEKIHRVDADRIGWIWGAFVYPLSWAMYRKLWGFAATIFAMILFDVYVMSDVAPDFHGIGIIVGIVTATSGKYIYVSRAKKKIKRIVAQAASPADALTQIEKLGGVSRLGGWIGALPLIAVVVIGAMVLLTGGLEAPQ